MELQLESLSKLAPLTILVKSLYFYRKTNKFHRFFQRTHIITENV